MKKRILVLAVICLAILSVVQVSADNFAAAFGNSTTNPAGNWAIGSVWYSAYFVANDGSIAGPPFNYWYNSASWSSYGYVGKNITGLTSSNVPAGKFFVAARYAAVSTTTTIQWTAPSAGTYNVNALYTALEAGNTLIYTVLHPVTGSNIPLLPTTGTKDYGYVTTVGTTFAYNTNVVLAAGDNLWFESAGDATLGAKWVQLDIDVTPVVPEPGSFLALGTGLVGLAGFVIRKRK